MCGSVDGGRTAAVLNRLIATRHSRKLAAWRVVGHASRLVHRPEEIAGLTAGETRLEKV